MKLGALVQALKLCTCLMDHCGSRGTDLLFLDRGTRRGSGQPHAPSAIYPRKYMVPFVEEAGWVPGPVWAGAEKLACVVFRSYYIFLPSVLGW